MFDQYQSRGVSSSKSEVKEAIKNQDKGLFPGAFCKIFPDVANGDPEYCSVIHADGAGTKSNVGYLMYKETGDLSVFRSLAQDSLVMNVDDLLCVGAVDGFLVSNTIGRNAHRVDGNVLTAVIEGYEDCARTLRENGISIVMAGGETADIGDLVSTIVIDSTIYVRLKRSDVVDLSNVRPGDVIVGLSSTGKAKYETQENSGLGSNGLTLARHAVLSKKYAEKYPESFSPTIALDKVYCGSKSLEDRLEGTSLTVGQALLSPTRTYAPVVRPLLAEFREHVRGLIHCTGGGQLKCLSFGRGLHYVKDNLFPTPALFRLIQNEGKIAPQEMYSVFNMGHRLEVYCSPQFADRVVALSNAWGIDARVVGRVEAAPDSASKNSLTIEHDGQTFRY